MKKIYLIFLLIFLILLVIIGFIYLSQPQTEQIYACADYVCKPESIEFVCNKTINTSFVNFC